MTKVQWWSWRRSVLGRFHLPCAPRNCLSSQPIISPTLFFGLTPAPESLATTHDRQDLVNDSIPQKHSWYTHDQTESLEAFQVASSESGACTASLVLDLVPLRHQLNYSQLMSETKNAKALCPEFSAAANLRLWSWRPNPRPAETDHPSALVSIKRTIFCEGLVPDHSRLQDTFTTIHCSFSQVHVASEKINIQKLLFKTPSSFHSNWSTDHFISELHHIPGSLCEWVRRWPSTWQVMSQFPSSKTGTLSVN